MPPSLDEDEDDEVAYGFVAEGETKSCLFAGGIIDEEEEAVGGAVPFLAMKSMVAEMTLSRASR